MTTGLRFVRISVVAGFQLATSTTLHIDSGLGPTASGWASQSLKSQKYECDVDPGDPASTSYERCHEAAV
jgi:hypothetical protein